MSGPQCSREDWRVDQLDSLMWLLGHGSRPQPCHSLGVPNCVLVGPHPCQSQASPTP